MLIDSTTQSSDAIEQTLETTLEEYPDLRNLTTNKIPHKNLIMEACCTNCACCGQSLTDAISVQRGMGPICSRRGYSEDPTDADQVEAFIALSEFPELADFLAKHYQPLGIRGLVNGLVRAASLNRPRGRNRKEGNERVFAACCDAIEQLGHTKMASVLRETLTVAWIEALKDEPGMFLVRVLRRDEPGWWDFKMKRSLLGCQWDEKKHGFRVRFHHPEDPTRLLNSRIPVPGETDRFLTNKAVVWNFMVDAFQGGVIKVNGETKKIPKKK